MYDNINSIFPAFNAFSTYDFGTSADLREPTFVSSAPFQSLTSTHPASYFRRDYFGKSRGNLSKEKYLTPSYVQKLSMLRFEEDLLLDRQSLAHPERKLLDSRLARFSSSTQSKPLVILLKPDVYFSSIFQS